MTWNKEAERKAEVARSLARALQEKFIDPAAGQLKEQEARLNILQEKMTSLEREIARLGHAVKKTAAMALAALAGLAITVIALVSLIIH